MQLPTLARYLSASLLCFSILGSCSTTTTLDTPPTPQVFSLPQSGSFSYHIFDRNDSYDFVGAIKNYHTGSTIGTGVLIAPNVVLSAGHVMDSMDMDYLEWVEVDGDRSCIEKIVNYPCKIGRNYHDIAIVFLESDSDKDPCVLFNNATDDLFKNMPLTTVGHGHGLRRNSNPGVFRYYGRLVLSPRFMIMLPLRDTIWHGDSGGAILTHDNKLIGIVTHYMSFGNHIYENAGASIEFYKEWIESHVATLPQI